MHQNEHYTSYKGWIIGYHHSPYKQRQEQFPGGGKQEQRSHIRAHTTSEFQAKECSVADSLLWEALHKMEFPMFWIICQGREGKIHSLSMWSGEK